MWACKRRHQPGAHSIPRMGSLAVSALMEPIAQSQRALITQLQNQCDETGVFRALDSYTSGDVVEIQTGPFASFLAEVVEMAPDQRIWVLIDLWGKNRALRWINKISDVRDESNKTSRHRHCLARQSLDEMRTRSFFHRTKSATCHLPDYIQQF